MVDKPKDLIVKIPLAKIGKWWNAAYGLISFSKEDFNTIIQNVKDNILGHPPYLTFGHLDEEHESTDSHRKRGDLIDIKVIGDTLIGLFKVKPLTYRFIKEGEYEFSSIEYLPEGYDKNTKKSVGKLLKRVGLTNSPFVPLNNKAVALSSTSNAVDRFCVVEKLSFEQNPENNISDQYNLNQNINNLKYNNMDPTINNTSAEAGTEDSVLTVQDVDSLSDTLEKKLSAAYESRIAAAEARIRDLADVNAKLVEDLSKTKNTARQYAAKIQATQQTINAKVQQNVTAHLLSIGLPKPLVNQAVSLIKAHAKGETTVSLSNDAGEVQSVNFTNALCSLIEQIHSTKTVDLSMTGSLAPDTASFNGFNSGYISNRLQELRAKSGK